MGRGQKPSQAAPTTAHRLKGAEALQQRAQRRSSDPTAANLVWEEAAEVFQSIISSLPSSEVDPIRSEDAARAVFGLGETLQGWAQSVMAAAAALPDEQHHEEEQAKVLAFNLLKQAIRFLNTAASQGPDDSLKSDAGVAAGNAGCAAAELVGEQQLKHALLQQACASYGEALRLDEDAMTHSNLADAMVTWAEHWHDTATEPEGGPGGAPAPQMCHAEAGKLYRGALDHYEASCALSSSEQGDDLPGAQGAPLCCLALCKNRS
eukprot:CAMPEP_0206136746 /NCGR_PEP_ID=MMETSP1473-20131121/1969_1 /ASSEMBLY_ACC=CAM_ASM_001109 /TAXON_ID=1461547 /ORGANISM="Stichococcus sp, Strain RCC1054" /LENGTH=263 /DNA_ID=CAMNT_0053529487 /DNA_START=78 /DNA_END=869 /DNA_ORIENTATION=+